MIFCYLYLANFTYVIEYSLKGVSMDYARAAKDSELKNDTISSGEDSESGNVGDSRRKRSLDHFNFDPLHSRVVRLRFILINKEICLT